MPRKALPIDTRTRVLHEAGYVCGNPSCRSIITLDMHHLDPVSSGGPDDPDNLLALCPNCHRRHHNGDIPLQSLRAWKMVQVALNHAYDKHTIDLLLMVAKLERLFISSDGLLTLAGPIASGLLDATFERRMNLNGFGLGGSIQHTDIDGYAVCLSAKGRQLVDAWLAGRQDLATS